MMSAAARNACAVAVVVLLVAACTPEAPKLEPATPAEQAAAAAPVHAPGELVLDLPFTDDSIRTLSGAKQADGLMATDQAGVLAFGPYREVEAGHYLLTVDGATDKPIIVEVISAKGAKTHAKQEIVAVAAGAPLATLPFDLDQKVTDLEVRLQVPPGSGAKLIGYRIAYR
jgi:hypothetical protein